MRQGGSIQQRQSRFDCEVQEISMPINPGTDRAQFSMNLATNKWIVVFTVAEDRCDR